MARIVQLIICDEHRGRGIEGDPYRIASQLWTPDGRLVAEWDPWEGKGLVTAAIQSPNLAGRAGAAAPSPEPSPPPYAPEGE